MACKKEEGELSDGEIDEEVERETAEMENADNLPEPAVPRPHSAPATTPSIYTYRESKENVANNSDFGSSDDNSDSDSDNDNRSWKRQKSMSGMVHPQAVQNPAMTTASSMQTGKAERKPYIADRRLLPGHPGSNRQSGIGPNKKRKNNIWGEVITQQTTERMEKEMTEFDMETENDRDIESYNYRLAVEEAPRHKLGMSAARMEMEEGDSRELKAGLGEEDTDKWLVDKAEGEEQRNVKERLGYKNVKDRLGLDAEIQQSKDEEMERKKRRQQRFKKKSAKHRLGQRTDKLSEEFTMKSITFSDGEHPKEVAGKIAFSLNEQKRHLIMRVVNILGVDKSKELWQQTWDVEESGGMMILNGGRRRFPGGVFLHLMKTDEDVTKQQVDEIFAEERKKDRKREKEMGKRKRKNKKMNFEKYLEETKSIIAKKREKEKEKATEMEEVDLEQDEGELQLDFMEGAGDSVETKPQSKKHDEANGDTVADKTNCMESSDAMST